MKVIELFEDSTLPATKLIRLIKSLGFMPGGNIHTAMQAPRTDGTLRARLAIPAGMGSEAIRAGAKELEKFGAVKIGTSIDKKPPRYFDFDSFDYSTVTSDLYVLIPKQLMKAEWQLKDEVKRFTKWLDESLPDTISYSRGADGQATGIWVSAKAGKIAAEKYPDEVKAVIEKMKALPFFSGKNLDWRAPAFVYWKKNKEELESRVREIVAKFDSPMRITLDARDPFYGDEFFSLTFTRKNTKGQ